MEMHRFPSLLLRSGLASWMGEHRAVLWTRAWLFQALLSSQGRPWLSRAPLCLHFHVCEKSVCHDPVGFLFLLFKVF